MARKATNRRPQTQKDTARSRERYLALAGLAAAATPVPSGKRYKRPAPGSKWSDD